MKEKILKSIQTHLQKMLILALPPKCVNLIKMCTVNSYSTISITRVWLYICIIASLNKLKKNTIFSLLYEETQCVSVTIQLKNIFFADSIVLVVVLQNYIYFSNVARALGWFQNQV